MLSTESIKELNADFGSKSPREILAKAFDLVPGLSLSFSGAEDVMLVHMASKLKPDVDVFTLDTGRLHPETYRFLELVRKQYAISLELLSPEPIELESFVRQKGLFSFYQDGHEQCCGIRKIAPLKRKLAGVEGWITGQRRDQSPTRTRVDVFELDTTHSLPGRPLLKVNPLANWTLQQVWDYIRMFDIPFNELHEKGYVSIGCEPCTRAIRPGQHEREGRWWWEESTLKECGLHKGNLKNPS
ncbi:MAG: phosphoadenylyl-sulfate reductase [Pseudohongiellaceae bacterium]